MYSAIHQVDIKQLSTAMGTGEVKDSEFIVFEGPIPPPKWYTPVRLAYYPLVCFESGFMKILVDLQHYELRKHDIMLLKPHQIVQVLSISDDASGKVIAFEKSFLAGENGHLIEKLAVFGPTAPPVFSLSSSEAQETLDSIHAIQLKVCEGARVHRRQVIINMIRSLLLELDSFYQAGHIESEIKGTRKQTVHNHFHSLLSAHCIHERTVTFYADLLNITPKYLTELTKEFTGKTAGELIDDRVVLEAKVLLCNPELSIKHIASILHFSDQFYFSKYFKNFAGISPSEYRNIENRAA